MEMYVILNFKKRIKNKIEFLIYFNIYNKMSSQFPLYETLKNMSINDKDISSLQKDEIVDHIKNDQKCHEFIYALIKSYQIDNDDIDSELYQSKKSNENTLKFNINKLPQKLQIILYKFMKKRNEELIRENEITKLTQENL